MVTNRNTSLSGDKMFRGKCWSVQNKKETQNKPSRRWGGCLRAARGEACRFGRTPLLLLGRRVLALPSGWPGEDGAPSLPGSASWLSLAQRLWDQRVPPTDRLVPGNARAREAGRLQKGWAETELCISFQEGLHFIPRPGLGDT